MKKLINIDLVPNFEKDDYEILKKRFNQKEIENSFLNVRNILKGYFPNKESYFFNSARAALTLLLSLYNKGNVLTQAFSCLVVPNSIKFAGLRPVFVDIDDSFNLDTNDLKRKINKETKAIIIQNTFGIPAKIDEILEIAKENKILVIENLTHSLGAKYKNTYLGNFGDAALLSFNRNKVVSSIIGGALIINNKELKEKIEEVYKNLENFKGIKKIIFTGKFLYQLKNNYNFFFKKLAIFLRKFGFISEMISDIEKAGQKPKNYLLKFPKELYPLLENQLKKLEKFNEHRKKIVQIYINSGLKNFSINENSEPIFLRFPVFHKKRDEILKEFKKENIYLGDWYNSVLAPKCSLEAFDYQQDCPHAEEISKKIFNLPTHIDIDEEKANYLAEKIKKWK